MVRWNVSIVNFVRILKYRYSIQNKEKNSVKIDILLIILFYS